MTDTGSEHYHEGEIAIQRRAGVRDQAEMIVQMYDMPDPTRPGVRKLVDDQPHAVVTSVDRDGNVWVSFLTGEPGFINVEDSETIGFGADPADGDPLGEHLRPGMPAGVLLVDPWTRGRLRVNGVATPADEGFVLEIEEIFPNCRTGIRCGGPWRSGRRSTPDSGGPGSRYGPPGSRPAGCERLKGVDRVRPCMNMLVDGEWVVDAEEYTDDDGEFQRQETAFREWVRDDPDARFQPGAGRYHLYVSYACPWAHRTLLVRSLKGLEDAISVSVVDPYREEDGWQFTPGKDGCTPDHVHGSDYLRELYVRADPNATGRVTVPVLWDRREDAIVNNESAEIMRMLDVAFDDLAERDVDLYPEGYREEVDRIVDEIYQPINNGVYRAGFAGSQAAYDRAVSELFDALDHWDEVLADRRYLAGDRLTEADVAMFTTLVRFDQVYHTHFMCNGRFVHQYENLWPYLRDLYQTPGVRETVRMDHIKEHYYGTHPEVNPSGIVAVGPDLDFEAPHDRGELPGGPPAELAAIA